MGTASFLEVVEGGKGAKKQGEGERDGLPLARGRGEGVRVPSTLDRLKRKSMFVGGSMGRKRGMRA